MLRIVRRFPIRQICRCRVFVRTMSSEKPPETYLEQVNDLYERLSVNIKDAFAVDEFRKILIEMEKEKKGKANRIKIIIAISAVSVIFLFYNIAKSWLGKQATNITMEALDDPKFQQHIQLFAKTAIKQLVDDSEVQNEVTNLLGRAIEQLTKEEYIIDALTTMFVQIVSSQEIISSSSDSTQDIVDQLINDPKYELLRKEIYQYLVTLSNQIGSDPIVHKNLGLIARKSMLKIIWQ